MSEKIKNEAGETIMSGTITYGDMNKERPSGTRPKSIIDEILDDEDKTPAAGRAKNYVSKKSVLKDFSLRDYAFEKWEGIKESEAVNYVTESKPWKYVRKNYLSWPVAKKVFSKNAVDNEGTKTNLSYAGYGLAAVVLKEASDFYVKTPSLRETASNIISWIPNETIENNFRHYLTIGGFQHNVLPEINNALHYVSTSIDLGSGDATNIIRYAGLGLMAASLGYLAVKQKVRKSMAREGKKIEKTDFKKDIQDVIVNSPLSSITTVASLVLPSANGLISSLVHKAGYAAPATTPFFKSAKNHPEKRKGVSIFDRLNAWYNIESL